MTPGPRLEVPESDIVNFTLESFTVSVGTTVTWTNRDSAPHTVTSGVPGDPDAGSKFDSGEDPADWLQQGQQFNFTFDSPRVIPYWCLVHPFMTGTVTVEQ